jgi:hypothetical protein
MGVSIYMQLKKLDYVVIIVLALFTVASFVGTLLNSSRKYNEKYVEIEVNGNSYKTYPLVNYEETIKIKTKLGENIIQIKDNKVHILDADCPDKVCIKDGYISEPGQILVCLPNKVVVEVKGKITNQEIDDSAF